MIKRTCLFTLAVLSIAIAHAEVRLPRIFGDNMVLQRGKPIAVWGWANPGEKITVQFHDQKNTAKADKQGRWSLQLDTVQAGGPYQLMVAVGKGTHKT